MDFVEAGTTQERLLLALIEKVEDNTAAITALVEQGKDKSAKEEGNVLRNLKPPRAFTVEEEARWIRHEVEQRGPVNDSVGGQHCRLCMNIMHVENVEHLRANGFEVVPYEWPPRWKIKWTAARVTEGEKHVDQNEHTHSAS